ncbi:MAG: lipoyl(octanoyl) transferase LipB [Rhodospirillales bacterium]|nr:lipoyl(octanoyl) transferase LipB [Rhodospirillales bacterium]
MSSPKTEIEWIISDNPVPYPQALAFMDERVAAIRDGAAPETVWLLEHPPIYTAGTSADISELVDPERFDVFETGRGGRYTYHGPGQRIAYVMLDLKKRGPDVRAFVHNLEKWVISTLAETGITGERREGQVGIWVEQKQPDGRGLTHENKIAAIGVRIRRWVTFHGISININPDLDHFTGIIPCGIEDHGITSYEKLNVPISKQKIDDALKRCFSSIF